MLHTHRIFHLSNLLSFVALIKSGELRQRVIHIVKQPIIETLM